MLEAPDCRPRTDELSPKHNCIYFYEEYRKLKAITEELKKENFEDTLSPVVASEVVIGEKIWRPKNYKD